DTARIAQMRREREIELAAAVDLVDRHQRALLHLLRHHGVGARSGKHEAERDRRLCHLRSSIARASISSQLDRSGTCQLSIRAACVLCAARSKKEPGSD